jgi:1,4-alpha-glucan branching enzyme
VGRNYGDNYAKLIPTAAYGTDTPLAMDRFAAALGASGQKKIVYHTSHDEAGNADKDNADREKRTHRTIVDAVRADPNGTISGVVRKYAEARCRFAAGVTLLSAGTPMILFGEEVGFQKDFKYNEVISNREDFAAYRNDNARGAFLFRFYRDLIRLRLGNAGLRSRNIAILHVHNDNRVVVFKRWGGGQEFLVLASLNNKPFNNPNYVVQHPDLWGASRWREVFNSDSDNYRGGNVGNFGATFTAQPGRLEAVIPANGFVVLARE